jgi:hypothetical protein
MMPCDLDTLDGRAAKLKVGLRHGADFTLEAKTPCQSLQPTSRAWCDELPRRRRLLANWHDPACELRAAGTSMIP